MVFHGFHYVLSNFTNSDPPLGPNIRFSKNSFASKKTRKKKLKIFWAKFMYKTYRENCLPVPGTSPTMLEVALSFSVTYFSRGLSSPTRRAWVYDSKDKEIRSPEWKKMLRRHVLKMFVNHIVIDWRPLSVSDFSLIFFHWKKWYHELWIPL